MKLIEAERVLKHINFLLTYGGDDKNTALKSLERYVDYTLPDAIIRCKDCKYQSKGSNEVDAWNLCSFRPWLYIPISDDYFCNFGERKTDEEPI